MNNKVKIISYNGILLGFYISLFIFLYMFLLVNGDSNYKNNALINILYWISLISIFICFFGVKRFSDLSKTYNKGGNLEKWYELKIKSKGLIWLNKTFDNLIAKGWINSNKKIVVVSPTANRGVYEKELFNYLSSNKISTKFILSDINLFENHEENCKNNFGEFIYLYEKNDARDIMNTLKKANEKSADVILDFEGCMWYVKEVLWHKKTKCLDQLIDVFEKYRLVLSEKGVIVVDNTKSDFLYTIFRRIFSIYEHFKLDIGENSTGKYLMYLYNHRKGKKFKKYIDDNFEMYPIDALNENGKIISVLCFRVK